jgi:adenine/guanine phosphoribosyltransferase-like PRPP-binding protein
MELTLQPMHGEMLHKADKECILRLCVLTYEMGGRETGVVLFKENDLVRVHDDAVLAPDAIRGEIGTVVAINRFMTEPTRISDQLIAVDRYQQLIKHPRETDILGFALQVYFPKLRDSMIVASNEVTLLWKFQEKVKNLENGLIAHLTNPQQFTVLGDGGLDAPFINQSFDAPFFGDLVKYVLKPKLGRTATKVLSPEASGPPLAAVYASMSGLNFVRAVKVYDRKRPQVPGTWRGRVIGDVQVPSATKKTEHYFAVPEGSISAEDRVIIFDDVGFTGRTRAACIQLVEKIGARVSAIVNVVEKAYGEPRGVTIDSKAILRITGFEPESNSTCKLTISELLMEKLQPPRIVSGVRYEPSRSLSALHQK